MEIENLLQAVIRPRNMVQEFNSKQEFIEWLDMGSTSDLEACLQAFVDDELFEHCVIIQDEISKRNGR